MASHIAEDKDTYKRFVSKKSVTTPFFLSLQTAQGEMCLLEIFPSSLFLVPVIGLVILKARLAQSILRVRH